MSFSEVVNKTIALYKMRYALDHVVGTPALWREQLPSRLASIVHRLLPGDPASITAPVIETAEGAIEYDILTGGF